MNTKALVKVIEDIYTLTWDYNHCDVNNASDMKSIIDTINYRINKFFRQNRVKIVWCEDEETNLYIPEEKQHEEVKKEA